MLLIPSRREGFPTVLLEAMASGCPVVAADVGGISELLQDGRTGTLVPGEDVEAMWQATTALLADENRRLDFGASGRRRIQETFTLDQSIARLQQLYETRLRMKQVQV